MNDTTEKIVWGPSSSTRFFARYDGPYIKETIELGNHPLRKILERQFEYMSRNLYFISAFGRYLLGFEREDDVAKAEDIAARTIQKAINSMGRRIEQAEELLKNSGIHDKTMYGKSQRMELPITTPGAKLYANLLAMTDQFYSLNAMLWFHGEIDNKQRFANESEARKEIQGVVRGVSSQFMFILNKTRAKDEKEASRAGEHNEEALANEADQDIQNALGGQSMTGSVSEADSSKSAKAKRTKKAAPTPEAVAAAA